jgi:hypothetical protein
MKPKFTFPIAYQVIVVAYISLFFIPNTLSVFSASLADHPFKGISNSRRLSLRGNPSDLPLLARRQIGIWQEFPVPVLNTLFSADFVSPDDGWAVGTDGKIVRWNGTVWTSYPSPANSGLTGIRLLSQEDGWAVGYSETLLHWNGQSWNNESSPTPKFYDLFAITFLSPTLGWAVGGGGDLDRNIAPDSLILKWDGEKWIRVSSPGHYPLRSIAMSSEQDGWAVGENNEILRWDGQSWQTYAIPGLDDFFYYSIAMSNSDDGWIAGWRLSQNKFGRYTQEGILLHWDGSKWSEYKRFDYGLFSISMVASDFGWAVGGNTYDSNGSSLLLHWDGKAWTEFPSPTTLPLHFVWAHDTQDGWLFAGGDNINSGFEGAVFRYVIEPTPTPTSSATASAVPTNTPPATATHISSTSTPFLPTATPTNTSSESMNSFSSQGVAWLLVASLLVVVAGGAVFIWRQRRKA